MPKLSKGEYGVRAHPVVRWLLLSESEVMAAVKRFIADMAATAYIDVAGPPTAQDTQHFLERRGDIVPLPSVRLHLRMVKGNLTGDLGVEITCSDRDITELSRWQMAAALKGTAPGRLLRA